MFVVSVVMYLAIVGVIYLKLRSAKDQSCRYNERMMLIIALVLGGGVGIAHLLPIGERVKCLAELGVIAFSFVFLVFYGLEHIKLNRAPKA